MAAILSRPQCVKNRDNRNPSIAKIELGVIYIIIYIDHTDGLTQNRRNSNALAMGLRLFCINSMMPNDAYMRQ